MGGEIGFDEGGVLQALFSRPVWSRETEHFKYNKKGLVTKRWTTKYDVSLGDVLIPLVLGGFLTLGALSLDFRDKAKEAAGGVCNYNFYVAMYGPYLGKILYLNCIREHGYELSKKDGSNKEWATIPKIFP